MNSVDVAGFPKGYKEERKFEILGGVKYMMPPPSTLHAEATTNSLFILKNHFRNGNCRVYTEHDLRLSAQDWVKPDVMVVCNPEIIKLDGIYGAPDLIVEVLSPSTSKRDRGYKFNLYEAHKVTEYWLVDVKNRIVSVYMLVEGKYQLDNEYYIPDEYELKNMTDEEKAAVVYEFKTHLSDELIIDIREVFENI